MSKVHMPTDTSDGVSVVIVSYNTRDWLETCITSVRAACAESPFEIIVVDNASVDGSADFVASKFPNVRLFRNDKNVGFAKAVNQGAASAIGAYVLLLNPDGYLKPGAIDALVAFARSHPEYIICGGRTLTPAGEFDPRSCWAAPSLWSLFCSATLLSTLWPRSRLFDPESMGWFRRDHARTVDIVSGCLLLAASPDWRQLGGFDERYFVYGEDADLCLRAHARTGRACAITPRAEMVHAVSASSASRADKLELLLKARVTLARTHLRGWRAKAGGFLVVAGVLVRAALEKMGASRATNWLEVWRRRSRWRHGYEAPPRSEPEPALNRPLSR